MTYDAVIIGGGLAGTSCALRLAQGGWCVALLEASRRVPWKVGETLGPESRPVLLALGLWQEFQDAGHVRSHGNVSAWGGEEIDERDFIFNPHGHAWQLNRVHFEESLLHAAERAGVHLLRGTMAEQVRRASNHWTIETAAGSLRAAWLVDATGRRSWLARALGVKRLMFDQLVAVHMPAVSVPATDQDGRTFIQSCADGWWYSARVPGARRTVSFQTDADLLPAQEWRDAAWFREQCSAAPHLAELLARHEYRLEGTPRLTSAHSGRLEVFGGPGWLAVGDAAMSFDPLSGYGMLKAMRSGLDAAHALSAQRSSNEPDETDAHFRLNESLWSQFLGMRTQYYSAEQRWAESPFWARRFQLAEKP